jgi:hypothetical protein
MKTIDGASLCSKTEFRGRQKNFPPGTGFRGASLIFTMKCVVRVSVSKHGPAMLCRTAKGQNETGYMCHRARDTVV